MVSRKDKLVCLEHLHNITQLIWIFYLPLAGFRWNSAIKCRRIVLCPEFLRLKATVVLLGQLEKCQNHYYDVSSKFTCKVVISLVHKVPAKMEVAVITSFGSNNG